MKILSLSCVYPNVCEPRLGLFVRARLRAVARHAEVRVLAPVARGRGGSRLARREFDGNASP